MRQLLRFGLYFLACSAGGIAVFLLIVFAFSSRLVPPSSATDLKQQGLADPVVSNALQESLNEYFSDRVRKGGKVQWEALRDEPTITGLSFPTFYVWVSVERDETIILEGAVRAILLGNKKFEVTDFLDRPAIQADPAKVARKFPAALIDGILARSGRTEPG